MGTDNDKERRKLNVDVDLLADFLSRGDDHPFEGYLDTVTGELLEVPGEDADTGLSEDELRAERARVDDAPAGRLERVPTEDRSEAYARMERFARSLDDVDDRDEVLRAISGKGAFRRFKDAIGRLRIVDKWHAFEAAAMQDEARDWLSTLNIEAPPSSRKPAEPPLPSVAAPAPVTVDLLDVALLGAPDGKTELIDGRVRRVVRAKNSGEARAMFKALARSICAYVGEPWRRRFLDGAVTSFTRDRFTLAIDENVVELFVAVDRATWERLR